MASAILGHLEESSQHAYGTGWRYFKTFHLPSFVALLLLVLTFWSTSYPTSVSFAFIAFLDYSNTIHLVTVVPGQSLAHPRSKLRKLLFYAALICPLPQWH